MSWEFHQDRPIYTQLLEKIRQMIISGFYPPGSKLPSVRELASEASVNPNTMQKALSELERSGLIYSQRTNGRYVTENMQMIQQMQKQLAIEKVQSFLLLMEQMGFSHEETLQILSETIKEES